MTGRRGITVIVVLVLVIVTALVAVGALDTGRAIASMARQGIDDERARALADAGVRALAEELLDQRDELLIGGDAVLPSELEMWSNDTHRAVAQLLVVGPSGERFVSEAAKLDLNRVDAPTLAALDAIGASLAEAIVGARPASGYASLDELLEVDGVTPELLYRDAPDLTRAWGIDDDASRSGLDESGPTALEDLLTVHSAEPNVQTGLSALREDVPDRLGQRRINLNRSWNDEMIRAIDDQFGEGTGSVVQDALSDRDLSDEEAFMRTLLELGVDAESLVVLLDAFCVSPDPYLIGRVDIGRAHSTVLRAVPGMSEEAVEQIVARRDTLDEIAVRHASWIVSEGIIPPEAYPPLADWLCMRSMQWRVRLRTGLEAVGDRVVDDRPVELLHERVHDVIIDLAAPRPRIAFVQDITRRPLVARFVRGTDEPEGRRLFQDDVVSEPRELREDGSGDDMFEEDVQDADTRSDDPPATASEDERPVSSAEEAPASERSARDGGVDRRRGRWTGPTTEEPAP